MGWGYSLAQGTQSTAQGWISSRPSGIVDPHESHTP